MRISNITATFVILASVFGAPALAQLGFGPQATFIEGADVWIDGELVRDCNIVFAGKKIRAVGPGVAKPSGARVIDGQGKTILPAFIDAASSVGLTGTATNRPHHRAIDRVDPFDSDMFGDAMESGVAYIYLRNAPRSGIGGQGQGLRIPAQAVSSLGDHALVSTDALHMAVGSSSGTLARVLEIEKLEKGLESAKKYREAWKTYDENLEKYTEELAEWAKKNKKKSGKGEKDKKKKDDAKKGGKSVSPASHDDHHDDHDADHDDDHDGHEDHDEDHGDGHDDHDEDHGDHEAGERVHAHDHSDPYADAPRYAKELREALALPTGYGETSPRPSFVGDGTEPHLQWDEDPRPARGGVDLSLIEISVCPHCSGIYDSDSADDHDHDHAGGFDFFQFALADPKEAKKDSKSGKKKKDGKPKQPNKPAFDPAREAVAKALEGEMRVRIEVHRAEDILAVLDMLDRYPMNVALEGVTEGWRVADEIARAGVPVILHAQPIKPRQERSGGGAGSLPFSFPFQLPRGFVLNAPSAAPTASRTGEAHLRNAAVLDEAGVPVVIASVGRPASATAHLVLSAAFAAGHGLSKGAAIKSVTTRAAEVLGVGESLGSISTGHLASFLILDGDPFAPTTSVERVYVDGERIYRKK